MLITPTPARHLGPFQSHVQVNRTNGAAKRAAVRGGRRRASCVASRESVFDDPFFSDPFSESVLRDIRAFERRMDSLTEQSANTERPSTFKRERESSSSYDQGGVRGYSYYKESIIVYGGAPSAPPQALQSSSGIPLFVFFIAGVWGAVAVRFSSRFERTSYKKQYKLGLAALWPLLAAFNESFRENLVKTFTDADGKSRGGTGGDYGGAQAGGRRESGQAVGRDEDKMEPGEGDVDKTRRR